MNRRKHSADVDRGNFRAASASVILPANGSQYLLTRGLSIDGRLDLTNNHLLVDYVGGSLYSDIYGYTVSGRSTGVGIVSTSSADRVLAVADNVHLAAQTFGGTPIDDTTIVCKYTYYGDANLDGAVTTDDYVAIDLIHDNETCEERRTRRHKFAFALALSHRLDAGESKPDLARRARACLDSAEELALRTRFDTAVLEDIAPGIASAQDEVTTVRLLTAAGLIHAVWSALYPQEMATFIGSNPGLKSRFTRYLRFDDYSPDELTGIFISFAEADGYRLTPDAVQKVQKHVDGLHSLRDKSFGNAREMRNLFESSLAHQALRLSALGRKATTDELHIIEASDILAYAAT